VHVHVHVYVHVHVCVYVCVCVSLSLSMHGTCMRYMHAVRTSLLGHGVWRNQPMRTRGSLSLSIEGRSMRW